jgi:tRNA-2-methylthio-N6-dimethylallyladenosine synthase
VHFEAPEGARPGDFVDVKIDDASAHYLLGTATEVTRTRGGDAHQLRIAETAGPSPTMLGIPTLKSR